MSRADAAAEAVRGPARPGRLLGRYELCAELARGGMASVFLARAHGLAGFEKLVAIKCIHPRYARERGFVEMFLDEARIASRITHPNVCSVFDVGEDGGVYFIAMDYLHGESLGSTMRALAGRADLAGARWQALASAIAADAAEGLHAAHELRDPGGEPMHVVHRDVSPQNVFLGYDGTVRVVDFGIARAVDRLHKTMSGVVKGKIAYMAPEQLRAEEVDRRADVWALGVVLWEMLTCERLFRRENEGQQIRAVLEAEIPAPSSVTPCAGALDAIVLRALARDRDERWQSARELGRELRRHLAAQGHVVSSAEIGEQMELLFREQRRAKEALIDRTRRGLIESLVPDTERMDRPPADIVGTVVPSDAAPARDSASGIRSGRTTEREYPAMAAPPPSEASSAAEVAPPPAATDVPAPGSREGEASVGGRWRTESVVLPVRRARFSLLIGALACAGIAVALVASRGGGDATEVQDQAAPVPVEPPPLPVTPVEREPAERPVEPEPPPPVEPASPERSTVRPAPPEPRAREARPSRAEPVEPEASEPTPAQPPAPGRVIVGVTGGWGTIAVDGQPMGQAPRAIELPPGRRVIEVMPFGEPPGQREVVEVEPGGTHRVVFEP